MRSLPWWRHQMETFSAWLAICAENSPVTGESAVTRSFGVFFDLLLNKQLSKQRQGWWFETLLYPLWRHCKASLMFCYELRIRTGINHHHNSITPLSSELFLEVEHDILLIKISHCYVTRCFLATVPLDKGRCARDALPQSFNIGVFKSVKKNSTTINIFTINLET